MSVLERLFPVSYVNLAFQGARLESSYLDMVTP